MYFTASISIAIIAFSNAILGAPSTQHTRNKVDAARALYFITNAAQNSVVALPIDASGRLKGTFVLTPTGGQGGGGISAARGTPAIPDSLFSQGAVTIFDNLLFTINPGSNTVSLLRISEDDPTYLTLVGTPQSTGGQFPVSVTYSAALKTACVVNGGAVDGVTCFSVSKKRGLSALDDSPRPLGLGQTTPPAGPPQTSSQILFSEDSTSLMVTVKGNPGTNTPGFIAIYPVDKGVVSKEAVKSSPPGVVLPFGISNIDDKNIIIADPAVGGARLLINPHTLVATAEPVINVTGQAAICWVVVAPKFDSAYFIDAGKNRVTEVDTNTGEVVTVLTATNGNTGMFDAVIGGDFLYTMAPTANMTHIAVFDISGGKGAIKEVENFEVVGLGSSGTNMGAAVFGKQGNRW